MNQYAYVAAPKATPSQNVLYSLYHVSFALHCTACHQLRRPIYTGRL